MENDSKFGLVVGIGLVIGVAVMFFQQDPAPTASVPSANVAERLQPPSPVIGQPVALKDSQINRQ